MKHFRFFIFLSLTLTGCGDSGDSGQQETTTDTSSISTPYIDPINNAGESLQALAKGFSHDTASVFSIDSLMICHVAEGDSLESERVYRFLKQLHSNSQDAMYMMNQFLRIDSVKQRGDYQGYVDGLDIGNIKDATCHSVFRANPSPEITWLFWGMDYHSYEACPWSNGCFLFLTIINGETVGETLCVGIVDQGGDPPAYGNNQRYSEISLTGQVQMRQTDLSDEDSEGPTVDLLISEWEYDLSEGKIKVLKEKKGDWKTVKRSSIH